MADLEKKILRLLNYYLYFQLNEKSTMYKTCRLWKSNYAEEEAEAKLKEVDQKYSNYTHVRINAEIINKSKEQSLMKL